MREALRSAFGYGLVIPTAGVPAETLEAATLAAGNAAVAEGTKQLLEGKKSSPTARYLDDLTPGSGGSGGSSSSDGGEGGGVASSEAAVEKKTADGLWIGAEAAAYAAGAAAGVSWLCAVWWCRGFEWHGVLDADPVACSSVHGRQIWIRRCTHLRVYGRCHLIFYPVAEPRGWPCLRQELLQDPPSCFTRSEPQTPNVGSERKTRATWTTPSNTPSPGMAREFPKQV